MSKSAQRLKEAVDEVSRTSAKLRPLVNGEWDSLKDDLKDVKKKTDKMSKDLDDGIRVLHAGPK